MLKKWTDNFGREVNVGDYIVYGMGRGGLQYGKVLEIRRKDVDRYDYQTKTTSIVEELKLQVGIKPYWKEGNNKVVLTESCSVVKIDSDTERIVSEHVDK